MRKSEPDPTKKVKEQLISLFNGSEKIESANKFEKFEDTAAIIIRTKKANIIFIAYQSDKVFKRFKNKIYFFFADDIKCFDNERMWLKDCLIETHYLGYGPGTIRSLYEINKTSNIVVDTPVGKISSITVEELVKQETIFGPVMYYAST